MDGRLGWVTRDHRRQVFHKMQLMTSRADEETRVGMMIAAACKPPTSGRRDGGVRAVVVDCSPGVGCAPALSSCDPHNTGLPGLEEAWYRARTGLEAKIE